MRAACLILLALCLAPAVALPAASGIGDADFRLRKVFVYGPGHAPDHVVTYDAAGVQTGRYRFVTDQLGSVLGLVDGGGAWVLEYDYDPAGQRSLLNAAAGVDESLAPFGFAGGLHDAATGLVRFGARDYDPWTARWMAKDPIDFDGGDTNLYAYVGGDPVNWIDPTGLQLIGLEGDGLWVEAGMAGLAFGDISAGLGDGVPEWVKVGIVLAAEEAALGLVTGGVGIAARWAGRAWRWARGGSKAKLACQLDETFEILDGVRRAKAAELAGQGTIRAEIDVGGRTIGTRDIPLGSLRSPKDAIDVSSSQRAMDRWESVWDATQNGAKLPPIRVTPGVRGKSIWEVLFE